MNLWSLGNKIIITIGQIVDFKLDSLFREILPSFGTINSGNDEYANYMHCSLVSHYCCDETDQMLKLTSFRYFSRQIIVSYLTEKIFSASLQKLFLPAVSELSFISHHAVTHGLLSSFSCSFHFNLSRNSVVHQNFCCWSYLSSTYFAWVYFSPRVYNRKQFCSKISKFHSGKICYYV